MMSVCTKCENLMRERDAALELAEVDRARYHAERRDNVELGEERDRLLERIENLLGRLQCSTAGGRAECHRAGAHVEDCPLHGLTPAELELVGPR